ncbi:MAG: roadblock/LC7 domain-containing protein [Herpetosiphon sp.]
MGLRDVLGNVWMQEGVDLAAVATSDGLLIESVANSDVDAEAICAVAAGGLAMGAALGREVKRGNTIQALVEYDRGVLLIEALNPEAVLLILTGGCEQIGRLRSLVRRHQAALMSALAAI